MVPASEPIMVSMAAIQVSLNLSLERMKMSEERTYTPWVQATAAHKWADDAATAVAVLPSAGLTSATTARCSPSVADVLAVRAGFPTTMPTSCSTYVLTRPPEGSTAGACAVNTDPPRSTSFPCFDGTNPRLWRTQCLEYFNRFNIHKCMWVIAATMHMEGKAKVWYEAYRLRQAVGEWSEFMDNVESHFGVADLPPSTTILGAAHFSGVVHASGVISPETPTRCLPVSPKQVTATPAEPTEPTLVQLVEGIKLQFAQLKLAMAVESEERKKKHLRTITQMTVPIADSSEEVLTHVNGVSLFLEPWVEPAGLQPVRWSTSHCKLQLTLGSLLWDPGGLCYACWVLGYRHLARIIKIYFMNLLLDVNVWEDSKSRILATELCFQWDPGIMLIALMDAMSAIGKLLWFLHLAQQAVYLHLPYLQALSELGQCMVLMYVSTFSIYLEIRLASYFLYMQWDPGACSLQIVARNLQCMLALIGNVDVVLNSTRLWPTDVEMGSFSVQADHSPIILCLQLNRTLQFGLSVVLEDAIDRLIATLSCTLNSNLFVWSTSSQEANAEWGIILIRNNSRDYGYEFYIDQQSKLHYAKSEFLLWPSKYLLMPWDPGIVTLHNASVIDVSRPACKLELDGAETTRHCLGASNVFWGRYCHTRYFAGSGLGYIWTWLRPMLVTIK